MAKRAEKESCSIPVNYIVEALLHGSGFVGGKKRIFETYQSVASKSERVAFLKKEYGTGGCGWPLEGYGLHGYDYDPKGMRLEWKDKNGEHKDALSWSQVEKWLNVLIENGDYYCSTATTNAELSAYLFQVS